MRGERLTSGWQGELEQAQRHLVRAAGLLGSVFKPTVDLAPAARAMEDAMGHIFDAFDQRTLALEAAQLAHDELQIAHAVLNTETADLPDIFASADAVELAAGHILDAQQALEALPVRPRGDLNAPMRASGDVPRLHALERASLTLAVRVAKPALPPPQPPKPLPRPLTFAELHENAAELARRNRARGLQREAESAKAELDGLIAEERAESAANKPTPVGFAPDARPAIDELTFIRERTRFHFEEVAMLGTQRAPMFGDRWRDVLLLEARLLRAIDAIVSMGPDALRSLEPLLFDAPMKDATRVFAMTMIMGTVLGRDALAAAERVFINFERIDPTCADAFADALKLVPHDQLQIALQSLLADPDAQHRAVGIDVLAHRALATVEQLIAACSDAPPVAAAALPYLALAAPDRCVPLVDEALKNPEVDRAAVWLAMILSGHRGTRMTLSAAVNGSDGSDAALREHAALLLALAGDRNDGALLRAQAELLPTAGMVDAVGWVGDPEAFPLLLRLLEHEDDAVGWAAGHALDRITGAWLIEYADLEAEEIYVEIPPDPKTGLEEDDSLVRKVSDPRDVPPEPARETVERPSRDPTRWKAWLQENGEHMVPGRRFRRGQPYLPRTTLQELDTFPCLLAERRALIWELVIRTGNYVRISVYDFVRVQEASLEAWKPIADRNVTSGTWDRPARS